LKSTTESAAMAAITTHLSSTRVKVSMTVLLVGLRSRSIPRPRYPSSRIVPMRDRIGLVGILLALAASGI